MDNVLDFLVMVGTLYIQTLLFEAWDNVIRPTGVQHTKNLVVVFHITTKIYSPQPLEWWYTLHDCNEGKVERE